MIETVIWGIGGKMGMQLFSAMNADGAFHLVAGVDKAESDSPLTVSDAASIREKVDVIVDFSRAESLTAVLALALQKKCAVVLASTGYSDAQKQQISDASKLIPVLQSGNMSIGVNLLTSLVEQAARALGPAYDIEIVEKHHNKKVDSPSGTAVMLLDAARKGRSDLDKTVYGRHCTDERRTPTEVGMHSLRGGTIVGEHSVLFAGLDEIIELNHTALSRAIFANGAVKAAKFIASAKPGLYAMGDCLM